MVKKSKLNLAKVMALAHHSLREVRLLDPSAGDPSRGVRLGRVPEVQRAVCPRPLRDNVTRGEGGWFYYLRRRGLAAAGGGALPSTGAPTPFAARGAEWPRES